MERVSLEAPETQPPEPRRGFWWGVLGGLLGSLMLIRFFPGAIPVDKRQILVQEHSAIVEVAQKVGPSVVSITSESRDVGLLRGQTGAGTGIIISEDGLILTNKHVVPADAGRLSVFTSDGKDYRDAKVVARDPQNDVAFVRINARGLKPAELGDSGSVSVGQKVVAIGNALGQFQNTVTEGIISGIGRPIIAGDAAGTTAESLENLLQTDAAINPGNSGGPLVNLEGQVIGINTAIADDGQNLGFAIPINEAKVAIASVKDKGRIVRPYLGVRYIAVTRELAERNSLSVEQGALITSGEGSGIIPDSPAAKAGLKEGDIVVKVGRDTVNSRNSLTALIGRRRVGERVTLTVVRDKQTSKITVTLQELPQ